jgi:hypothetical protein
MLKVFEKIVLRRISEPKRDGVSGSWKKLHNELYNLYSSPSIIIMIKSRRTRLTGRIAHWERRGILIGFLWGIQKERVIRISRHKWRIILRWTLER